MTAFSIALIRLPLAFGDTNLARIAVLVPLVAALLALPPVRRSPSAGLSAVVVVLFVASVVVALFRGALAHQYSSLNGAAFTSASLVLMTFLGARLTSSAPSREELDRRLAAIALAPAAYVATNFALLIAGQRSQAALDPHTASLAAHTPAQLLSFLGIHTDRVEFPLANSINNFGIVASAGFAAAAMLALRVPAISRWLTGSAAAVCLAAALATDSRGSLFVAVGVVAAIYVMPRVRTGAGLALALPLSPAIVVGGLGFLANSGFVTLFSRTGDDLLTGTGRLYIWSASLSVLSHPQVEHVYGYGAAGQIPSGASTHYAYLFAGTPDPFGVHTHNIAIQTVLDSGYIGLVILVAVVVSTTMAFEREVRARHSSPAVGVLAFVIATVLAGATEAAPTYYSEEALFLCGLSFGAAAGLQRVRAPIAARTSYAGRPRAPSYGT